MLIVATCSLARGQSIERQLIGTAGTTYSAGNYFLCYSLGEAVVTPSPSSTFLPLTNAFLLSIGFQQPYIAPTGKILYSNIWVSAYPNPTTGWVRLTITGDNNQPNVVIIYNSLGQKVAQPGFNFINGNIDLDLSALPAGVYTIAVSEKVVPRTVSIQILKIGK